MNMYLHIMPDIYKVLVVGLACSVIGLLIYHAIADNTPREGNDAKGKRLIYTVYTTSADSQTLNMLERFYSDTPSQYYYVIDDTASKSIIREFPESRRILLGASIQELDNAVADQAQRHHFTSRDIVAYDIEDWASTPVAERADAAKSITDGARLVHSRGYSFGLTPDQKILLQWYTRIDWRQVDFLILQLQTIANDMENLRQLTNTVSEYAKSANPDIEIFLQLSLRHSNARQIIDEIETTRHEIDGVVIAYVPDVTKPPCRYCSPDELEQVLRFLSNHGS